MLMWTMAMAGAHPMGRTEHSLRTGLQVTDAGIHAVLVGEIPIAVVVQDLSVASEGRRPTEDQVAAYTAARHAELASSATLRLGPVEVDRTWTPVDNPANGKAIDGFFVYMVEVEVPADELGDVVDVVTGTDAFAALDTVFYTQARAVGTAWTLSATSASDGWIADPAHRQLSAQYTRTP